MTLETIYDEINFDTSNAGYTAVGNALIGGTCPAAILPKVDFDTLATQPTNCQLSVVGGSLFFSVAGWVTNLNNSMCIQRAIEFALHKLQGSGKLTEIFNRWMPIAACATAPPSQSTGRQLGEFIGAALNPAAYTASPNRGRRRLATTGAVAASASGSDDDLTVMTPESFAGVFILWGAIVVSVCTFKIVANLYRSYAARKSGESGAHSISLAGPKGPAYPEGLDINDTSAMLRHLVLEAESSKRFREEAKITVSADAVSSNEENDALSRIRRHSQSSRERLHEALQTQHMA